MATAGGRHRFARAREVEIGDDPDVMRVAFLALAVAACGGAGTGEVTFIQKPHPTGGLYMEARSPSPQAAAYIVMRARRACPDGFDFTEGPSLTAGSTTTYAIVACHPSIDRDGLNRYCFDTLGDGVRVSTMTCTASEDGCEHSRTTQPTAGFTNGDCTTRLPTGAPWGNNSGQDFSAYPDATHGCPCGNSWIACSKTCHNGDTYRPRSQPVSSSPSGMGCRCGRSWISCAETCHK